MLVLKNMMILLEMSATHYVHLGRHWRRNIMHPYKCTTAYFLSSNRPQLLMGGKHAPYGEVQNGKRLMEQGYQTSEGPR